MVPMVVMPRMNLHYQKYIITIKNSAHNTKWMATSCFYTSINLTKTFSQRHGPRLPQII